MPLSHAERSHTNREVLMSITIPLRTIVAAAGGVAWEQSPDGGFIRGRNLTAVFTPAP